MVERQAARVLVDEREGGARHLRLVYAERGCDALDEDGFARAERAIEQDGLAALEELAEMSAQAVRLFRTRADPLTGGCVGRCWRRAHGRSPSASSARMAAPKCSRMSDAVSVRMPLAPAARSPARPPT